MTLVASGVRRHRTRRPDRSRPWRPAATGGPPHRSAVRGRRAPPRGRRCSRQGSRRHSDTPDERPGSHRPCPGVRRPASPSLPRPARRPPSCRPGGPIGFRRPPQPLVLANRGVSPRCVPFSDVRSSPPSHRPSRQTTPHRGGHSAPRTTPRAPHSGLTAGWPRDAGSNASFRTSYSRRSQQHCLAARSQTTPKQENAPNIGCDRDACS